MRSLGMALVLFLIIRTFLLEAFQIPSGSMERTLLAGDFLFVNKAVYGAQIPGTNARLPGFNTPQRGDVIVFAYPKDPTLSYVKRVIGASGDVVEMRLGQVYLNGRARQSGRRSGAGADRARRESPHRRGCRTAR